MKDKYIDLIEQTFDFPQDEFLLSQFDISTHTLTWSVTIPDDFLRNIEVDFNSHAHVERDARNSSRNCVKKSFQLTRSRGA